MYSAGMLLRYLICISSPNLFLSSLQCVCSASTPLPSLLVFPHIELVLMCVTVIAISQVYLSDHMKYRIAVLKSPHILRFYMPHHSLPYPLYCPLCFPTVGWVPTSHWTASVLRHWRIGLPLPASPDGAPDLDHPSHR